MEKTINGHHSFHQLLLARTAETNLSPVTSFQRVTCKLRPSSGDYIVAFLVQKNVKLSRDWYSAVHPRAQRQGTRFGQCPLENKPRRPAVLSPTYVRKSIFDVVGGLVQIARTLGTTYVSHALTCSTRDAFVCTHTNKRVFSDKPRSLYDVLPGSDSGERGSWETSAAGGAAVRGAPCREKKHYHRCWVQRSERRMRLPIVVKSAKNTGRGSESNVNAVRGNIPLPPC